MLRLYPTNSHRSGYFHTFVSAGRNPHDGFLRKYLLYAHVQLDFRYVPSIQGQLASFPHDDYVVGRDSGDDWQSFQHLF